MNRRSFLNTAIAFALARSSGNAMDLELKHREDIAFRFAVGGDPHYGQRGYAYKAHIQDIVKWINSEKKGRGMDVLFLNGDIVHDTAEVYEELIDDHLSKLDVQYYAVKGNHDFLRPDQSWEKIWGYPENHVVDIGERAFVLADTSIGADNRNWYSAADNEWLTAALEGVKSKGEVYVIMHIQQRAQNVTVDGYTWPQYGVGHQGHEDTEMGEANMRLIESHENVRAVFHSHNHRKILRYMSGGKPYFFCGRMGGNLLGGNIPRGYRVVEVYKDGSSATYYNDGENQRMENLNAIAQASYSGIRISGRIR